MVTIEELCSQLKEKRKELGYSLEVVVDKTKLYPSVIRDIEDANLSNINTAYLKGFLKIYANFLHIEMPNTLEVTSLDQPAAKKEKKKKVRVSKSLSPKIKKLIFNVFAAGIVLICAILLVRFIAGKINTLSKEPKKQNKRVSESLTEKNIFKIPYQDEIKLSLTAKKETYIKVNVDGKLLFQGTLKKGVVETWKGYKKIVLVVGDASAIYMEVNGKSIPPISSMRKPVKNIKITPAGIAVNK